VTSLWVDHSHADDGTASLKHGTVPLHASATYWYHRDELIRHEKGFDHLVFDNPSDGFGYFDPLRAMFSSHRASRIEQTQRIAVASEAASISNIAAVAEVPQFDTYMVQDTFFITAGQTYDFDDLFHYVLTNDPKAYDSGLSFTTYPPTNYTLGGIASDVGIPGRIDYYYNIFGIPNPPNTAYADFSTGTLTVDAEVTGTVTLSGWVFTGHGLDDFPFGYHSNLGVTFTFTIGELLFTPQDDVVDFGTVKAGSYPANTQYDAIGGNDLVTLPADAAAAAAAGYGISHQFNAGAGNDSIHGQTLDDTIHGDAGNDQLDGGVANDKLYGDDNDDELKGGDGTDILIGGLGFDDIRGGNDADVLLGLDGDYSPLLGAVSFGDDGASSYLDGEDGNDTVYGGKGAETLVGGNGNDSLNGGDGPNQLFAQGTAHNGLDGKDTLRGGTGDDQLVAFNLDTEGDSLIGGDGVDTFFANNLDTIEDFAKGETIYALGNASIDNLIAYSESGSTRLNFFHQGPNGLVKDFGIVLEGPFDARLFNASVAVAGDTFAKITYEDSIAVNLTDVYANLVGKVDNLIAKASVVGKEGRQFAIDKILSEAVKQGLLNKLDFSALPTNAVEAVKDVLAGLIVTMGKHFSGFLDDKSTAEIIGEYAQNFAGALGGIGEATALIGKIAVQFWIDDLFQRWQDELLRSLPDVQQVPIHVESRPDGGQTITVHEVGTLAPGAGTNQHDYLYTSVSVPVLPSKIDDVVVISEPPPLAAAMEAVFGQETTAEAILANLGVTIVGNRLANSIVGNTGDDSLDGAVGSDSVVGSDGNDTLSGGPGADSLVGGVGSDVYRVDNAKDLVDESGGDGTDNVQSTISYLLAAGIENLELLGSRAVNGTGNVDANRLAGNKGANKLDGKEGADTLEGNGGNDTFVVNDASDQVIENIVGRDGGTDLVLSAVSFDLSLTDHAQIEKLTLTGGAFDNIDAMGNALANTLTGNAGNNLLNGMGGVDKMAGGLGDDTYVIDLKTDRVTEGKDAGTDTVQSILSYVLGANLEKLELLPGAGNVDATGNTADNRLTGNDGNNKLDGKGGGDTMLGGLGNDTYVVDKAGDVADETGGGGTDTLVTPFATILGADFENLTLTGTAAVSGTGNAEDNTILGNSGANALDGLEGHDSLVGGSGNDMLTGGAGNDTLDGGTGADDLAGGEGDDSYVVDNAKDAITELADGGTDTVQSSVTHTLAAEVENLTLTGAGAINGTGNELGNLIVGNTAANILSGGDGNDILDGGKGTDKLTGGAGSDTFLRHSLAEGKDTITDFETGAGGDVLDISDILTGFAAGHEAEFVQCVTAGGNTTVKVDADGTLNGSKFTDVCVLTGVTTPLGGLLAGDNMALTASA
jgi:Ca2+-binding RTX toxin-like protein